MSFLRRFLPSIALTLVLLSGCARSPLGGSRKRPAVTEVAPTPPMASADPGPVPLVRFYGAITEQSTVALRATLERLDPAGVRVVVLELNSPGGSVPAAYEAARAVERYPRPVFCVVDGEAESMAFFLLQSCDRRYMTARSVLMVHQPYSMQPAAPMRQEDYEESRQDIAATAEAILGHEARRLKVSRAWLRRRIAGSQAWYLLAPEALAAGAIDGVIPSVEDVQEALRIR